MSSAFGKLQAFISRNIVLIVCVPALGGLHFAWQKIQEDDSFVQKHERREFPPITLFKFARHWVGFGDPPEKHSNIPPGPPS